MKQKTFEDILSLVRGKPMLVANRGIPARRILRAFRERFEAIPIMTVTDVDKTSPVTAGAQELLLLGDDPRAYLELDLIIRLAKNRGVVAIHPGWGFASEDESFPAKCEAVGITFIGSNAISMHKLGNKVELRILAKSLGIPVVPGSDGAVDFSTAYEVSQGIGFPILLKAEGGGGGRGIYEVYCIKELRSAFDKASAMAEASFGNPRLFIEKLLNNVRHIEIQVVADKHGNVFAFDERDCTVQRNHQKLIEITPSPWRAMTKELREQLKEYAIWLVRAVDYFSLATVEFLVDAAGRPYLIEVNTRLQVEHGITECRYGIDLVEEQIAIAFGSELRFTYYNTRPMLHAIQVRINCEDPQKNFSPNSGLITRYISTGGPGIRLDSCISAGYEFPFQYDSAASLLIAYGQDWIKVVSIMQRALREYIIGGVKSTIPFYRQILRHETFRAGEFNTGFIEQHPELMCYTDLESEALRLSRLVAEIAAKGYNPYVQLGIYRTTDTPRLGRFNPVLPVINYDAWILPYPHGDRTALLDYLRDAGYVHFTDTTARDITQSNSGNRFRLAEDELVGPYLDNCGFFSLENGGGAHFHAAMLTNMTYPFTEARKWKRFAPRTLKQILVRSTNVLGYKPQPKNLVRFTGEMINEEYDVIRCFDFLNHIENMRPLAEIVLLSTANIFEPAISLSWSKGFDVPHYLGVVEEVLGMVSQIAGVSKNKAARMIILGLKDMAGVCPQRFITALVTAIRKAWPELVIHYHRHCTDGLFIPAVSAAVKSGAHIIDTAIGASVRWYGQGDVLSTAAYIENELGLKTNLNEDMIRMCNFVLKQIMPYYDRYTAPYFQGVDYDVIKHGMPGGAISSSQEGAMKQGYIHLLPYMLKFLAGTRKVVRYHDVTPGSQITWNTAFLAITSAYKRGGGKEVECLLEVLDKASNMSEDQLTEDLCQARLALYRDVNDAFRHLLLGGYGRMPLGFPPVWVYESAFGSDYHQALSRRTETSPVEMLADIDIAVETGVLSAHLKRGPTAEEVVLYLNHPGDALKTIEFVAKYGDCNRLPLDVWFEGLEMGQELNFTDSSGKPHQMTILHISRPTVTGNCVVRYVLDSEIMSVEIRVTEPHSVHSSNFEIADLTNPYHVAAPSDGDMWIMHVKPGDLVHVGEELFNISIMKQEKAVLSPVVGLVKRVLKTAHYSKDRKMVQVKEGELLVEIESLVHSCSDCGQPLMKGASFCSYCGYEVEVRLEACR